MHNVKLNLIAIYTSALDFICFYYWCRLGCGTTWHSVGLISVGKDDPAMMKLLQYSRNLYEGFEQEEDGGIGSYMFSTCFYKSFTGYGYYKCY